MSIDYTEPIAETESLVRPERSWEDGQEYSLRPTRLSEYIGQAKAKGNLEIFIQAAKLRQEPLDHVLLYGPPGLGKTTLSRIIANEMNVNIRTTSGPAIEKPGDLAALLTNLQENDILFIDEIHRMNRTVEEILYPAMEDYAIDIIIGKGPSANSIRLDLPRFAPYRQPDVTPGSRLRPGAGGRGHHPEGGGRRADRAGGGRAGTGLHRPPDAPCYHGVLRRRPRGLRHPGGHHQRGHGDLGGYVRAVPDAAGLPDPDAPGTVRDPEGLRTSGNFCPTRGGCPAEVVLNAQFQSNFYKLICFA